MASDVDRWIESTQKPASKTSSSSSSSSSQRSWVAGHPQVQSEFLQLIPKCVTIQEAFSGGHRESKLHCSTLRGLPFCPILEITFFCSNLCTVYDVSILFQRLLIGLHKTDQVCDTFIWSISVQYISSRLLDFCYRT